MRTLLAALAAALVLSRAPDALAHARLLSSEPADQARLASAPKAIELHFNEILDDDFNSIDVFPAAAQAERGATPVPAKSLTSAPAAVDEADRTRLVAPVQALEPGTYAVEWKVLSRDGHTARGRYTFTVQPSGEGAR
jgi:methionine-rich copper-binding protein CopC